MEVIVPNPLAKADPINVMIGIAPSDCKAETGNRGEHLIPLDRFSDFKRLVRVNLCVLKFIHNIKLKLKVKYPDRFGNFNYPEVNLYLKAYRNVIRVEQGLGFPEVFAYFESGDKWFMAVPNIVAQLNIYMEKFGILRVRCKVPKWKQDNYLHFPILLHKDSKLTNLIVLDMHQKFGHLGLYALLSEMRKKFWIPHYFSVVKNILKGCIQYKRFNERTVKLNQSSYRDFRTNPPKIPFSYIFVDHLGPYYVKVNGKKSKVWLLCLTCLWTRAINLKLCLDLSTKEFLRSLQMHCFEYGILQLVLSDLGSQIVAGANSITNFLNDSEVQSYFHQNNVKPIKFEQYFKGCNKMGGLVETCVKLTKKLLYTSIHKHVLYLRDFEFFVGQTVHLLNKRPIAFKEALRDTMCDEIPDPITPEILIHGRSLLSVSIIPELHVVDDDPAWLAKGNNVGNIVDGYLELGKVRQKLIDLYHSEFVKNLIYQATKDKDMYRPVTHNKLKVGDVVLLKESNMKPVSYLMGVVKDVVVNDINEVTGAVVLKGATRELVNRHVTSLIPILSYCETDDLGNIDICDRNPLDVNKIKRKAAVDIMAKTKAILSDMNN
ncbi:uncharacterized protein [Palaemon carinicauda]|uniref:uncharacterized protein n=1 Tax=Palaemon carinicauda TaxID=392227 RepID=UPI0035B5BE33